MFLIGKTYETFPADIEISPKSWDVSADESTPLPRATAGEGFAGDAPLERKAVAAKITAMLKSQTIIFLFFIKGESEIIKRTEKNPKEIRVQKARGKINTAAC
jgi:hypothetical protein